jgi:hypothetical protein
MPSSCGFTALPQTSVRSELVEDRCDVATHFDKLSANGVWSEREDRSLVLTPFGLSLSKTVATVQRTSTGSVRTERGASVRFHATSLPASSSPGSPFGLSPSKTVATWQRTSTSSVRTACRDAVVVRVCGLAPDFRSVRARRRPVRRGSALRQAQCERGVGRVCCRAGLRPCPRLPFGPSPSKTVATWQRTSTSSVRTACRDAVVVCVCGPAPDFRSV